MFKVAIFQDPFKYLPCYDFKSPYAKFTLKMSHFYWHCFYQCQSTLVLVGWLVLVFLLPGFLSAFSGHFICCSIYFVGKSPSPQNVPLPSDPFYSPVA